MSTEIFNSKGTRDFDFTITKVCEGMTISNISKDATIEIIEVVRYSEGEPRFYKLPVTTYVDLMQKVRTRKNGAITLQTPPAKFNSTDNTYTFKFYFTSLGFIPFKKDVYAYKVNITNAGAKHVKFNYLNTPIQGAVLSDDGTIQGSHLKMSKRIMESTESTEIIDAPFADYLLFPSDKPDKMQFSFPNNVHNDLDIDLHTWENQNESLGITQVDQNGAVKYGMPNNTLVFDMHLYDTLKFFKSSGLDLEFYEVRD